MGCPMTIKFCKDNDFTEEEQKAFCDKGCSVICEELLKQHIARKRKREVMPNEVHPT